MQKGVLWDLFKGDLIPIETKFVTNDEIEQLRSELGEEFKFFQDFLTDAELKRIEGYMDKLLYRASIECEELQFEQFKLGIRIGHELWKMDQRQFPEVDEGEYLKFEHFDCETLDDKIEYHQEIATPEEQAAHEEYLDFCALHY